MDTLERISYLLIKTGKKQIDLTDYLKLKKSAFSNWKSGRNKSYLRYLPNIAEFFNVTVDYLLGESDNPTDKNKKIAVTGEGNSDYDSLFRRICILDAEDRQTVVGLVDTLLAKEKYIKKPDQIVG